MENQNGKSLLVMGLALVAVVVIALVAVLQKGDDLRVLVSRDGSEVVQSSDELGTGGSGLSGTRFPRGISADATSPVAGEVRGTDLFITDDATILDDITVSGDLALSGSVNYLESYELATATDTLFISESGKTLYLSGVTTTYYLPDVALSAGGVLRFVIGGDITATTTISTSDGSDVIEGALIVAGAVVDCDAEDRLEFIANGENLGDFVELRSNGSKWYIGASGALTANKLYCTKT